MEEDRTSIYALVDPRTDEVRYIGKTNNAKKRLYEHIRCAKLGKTWHVSRWIRSLLKSGLYPDLILLENPSVESWQEREIWWISYYRENGARLTNIARGGLGGFSDEVLKRVHQGNLGRTCSVETRHKMSVAKRGVKKSPEHVEAVRVALTGRKAPETAGERNPNAKLGSKEVLQIRALQRSGLSGVEVARKFGITTANVSLICNYKAWTHLP